jgi:hypothetical protein
MTSTGMLIWGSYLSRRRQFTDKWKVGTFISLSVRFGKWIQFDYPSIPEREFRTDHLEFQVPRPMYPQIWVTTHTFIFGKGDVVSRRRVRIEHKWHRHERWWTCSLQKMPKLPKVKKPPASIRVRKIKARPSGRKQLISGRKSNPPKLRPNPLVKNSTRISAFEDFVSGSGQTPYSQSSVSFESYRRSFSSIATPNFRVKNKIGQLPVNPYSLDLTETDDGQAYRGWDKSPDFNHSWNTTSTKFPGFLVSPPEHNALAYDKAVKRLIDAAESDIAGNIAQDFAQFGQTTRMIAQTCHRLTGAIRNVKRGRLDAALSYLTHGKSSPSRQGASATVHSKGIAENWLELQYGWKPLLMDVDGAMRSLANYISLETPLREIRSSAKARTRTVDPYWSTVNGKTLSLGYVINSQETKCKLGCRYTVEDSQRAFFQQLGFTNPINLAWEILPYSFVIDWFLPIGPYLSAMTAWEGLKFLDGFRVMNTLASTEAEFSYAGNIYNFANGRVDRGDGSYSRKRRLVNRVKLIALPTLDMPILKNPFSTRHVENALALMRTAFRH